MIDLHIHSTASDGIFTPQEIVKKAVSKGLKAISITDHDTVQGVKQVLGLSELEVISGVELSTWHEGVQLHILGYGFDVNNEFLLSKLNGLKLMREGRADKILEKLNKQGVGLSKSSIECEDVIARPNIARALVKQGFVNSISEAFDKYLGSGATAFVPKELFSLKESINMIKKAGGVPVLAHPGEIKQGEVEYWLNQALMNGIMGVELYHPNNDECVRNVIKGFVEEHGLLITGGSDCHGKLPKERMAVENIPYEHFKELKKVLLNV